MSSDVIDEMDPRFADNSLGGGLRKLTKKGQGTQ